MRRGPVHGDDGDGSPMTVDPSRPRDVSPTRPGRRHAAVPTRLGDLVVVADGEAIAGLYFPHHWTDPDPARWGEVVDPADPVIARATAEVTAYLEGELTAFTVPVTLDGTAFQQRVWAILLDIPYAETTTYGTIARTFGNPGLAQEVGQAVGANPVSMIVPCHRVVGSDGRLTGYAGGLERKAYLLALEEFVAGRSLVDPR